MRLCSCKFLSLFFFSFFFLLFFVKKVIIDPLAGIADQSGRLSLTASIYLFLSFYVSFYLIPHTTFSHYLNSPACMPHAFWRVKRV